MKARFVEAMNCLVRERQTVIEEGRVIQKALTDCGEIDQQLAVLHDKIEVVIELTHKCIAENSVEAQDQAAFQERYAGYVQEYESLKHDIETLGEQKEKRLTKANAIGGLLFAMSELEEAVEAFDEKLWVAMIDKVAIHREGGMTFKFQTGVEIAV